MALNDLVCTDVLFRNCNQLLSSKHRDLKPPSPKNKHYCITMWNLLVLRQTMYERNPQNWGRWDPPLAVGRGWPTKTQEPVETWTELHRDPKNRPLWVAFVLGISLVFVERFLSTRRLLARYLLWKDGWLVVTRQYCIKTDKPILKLSRPSGSHIILVFWPLAPIPNSKGNLFSGGYKYKYTGWENVAIFDWNRRLSRKRWEIGRWLLWNVNRKSWVPDQMV